MHDAPHLFSRTPRLSLSLFVSLVPSVALSLSLSLSRTYIISFDMLMTAGCSSRLLLDRKDKPSVTSLMEGKVEADLVKAGCAMHVDMKVGALPFVV